MKNLRLMSRRAALAAAAGAAATPLLARAQTPLGYKFRSPAPDRGLGLMPTLACTSETTRQGEGPFYTPATPQRASLIEPGFVGIPLVLTGLVLTPDCKPVPGAVLDFWHCDQHGVYDNAEFRYRGHHYADASGSYQLETIRPGFYTGRTTHIHVKVQGPKTTLLTTQIYFPDYPEQNFLDSIYRDSLLMLLRRTPTSWEARFDFVIPDANGRV